MCISIYPLLHLTADTVVCYRCTKTNHPSLLVSKLLLNPKSCSSHTHKKGVCSDILTVLFNPVFRCSSVYSWSVCNWDWNKVLPLVARWSNKLSSGSGVHPGGRDRPLPCLHAPLALRHEPGEVRALHIRGLCRQPQQFRLRGVLHGCVQAPE